MISNSRSSILSVCCGLALLIAGRAAANTITVTNTNDTGAGSLRDAVATAASGDTINFNLSGCPCTIVTSSQISITGKALLIQGPGASQLTISGNNAHRIFSTSGSSGGVTISDLTISNGAVSGAPGGGAIFNGGAQVFAPLTLANCVLNNNSATGGGNGGAIHVASGAGLSVVNCTFSNNNTSSLGGAIGTGATLSTETPIAIFNCTFTNNTAGAGGAVGTADKTLLTSFATSYTNNTAKTGGGLSLGGNSVIRGGVIDGNHLNNTNFSGGGLFNSGTLDLSGASVSNNDGGTTNDGGGIANNGTLTVNQCAVSGNHAGRGGGIYCNNTLVINESTIADNTALGTVQPQVGGGGIYHSTATATITASTISGNKTNNSGGGLVNAAGTMTLTNSTISANQVSVQAGVAIGGGLHNDSSSGASTASVTSCTIAFNTGSHGGGISSDAGSTVTANSTLIGSNTAPSGPDILGIFSSTGYNFIGNNGSSSNLGFTNGSKNDIVGGRGNAPIDPLLVSLADNGGLTRTNALQPGSPVIDKGNSPFGLTTDQRGFPRCYDAPASVNLPGGNFSDIGAFEYADSTLRVTSIVRPANGHIVLHGIGLPNAVHSIQTSMAPSGPSFATIGPVLSDLSGNLQFEDDEAASLMKQFYRFSFP